MFQGAGKCTYCKQLPDPDEQYKISLDHRRHGFVIENIARSLCINLTLGGVLGTPCLAMCLGSKSPPAEGGHWAEVAASATIGCFNTLAILGFVIPFLWLWLAWLYPLIAIPPVLAYTLLSFDGSEQKDGKPWRTFTEDFWIFKLARNYFDLQCILDPALDPEKMTGEERFVFGLHPHGVVSDFRLLLDGMIGESFPKLQSWRTLAASVLFKFPLFREICLWSHCIDAGRATAQRALEHGHSLFVVPGGEHEQVLGSCGKELLYLRTRKGFVKLALKNNVPLVPVFIFGCNDVYGTSALLQGVRLWLVRRMRVGLPLFWGRWFLPIPRRVSMRIVFGAPLSFGSSPVTGSGMGKMPQSREVSDEELNKAHAEYVKAITTLFEDNKARFGYADRELVIV